MKRAIFVFLLGVAGFNAARTPADLPNALADAAQEPVIDRVEEDWEVVINVPDQGRVGPQITTTMSPIGTNRIPFVAFNLNYRDSPFRAGGLQVQVWDPTVILDSTSQKDDILSHTGELLTWTQRMQIEGGQLLYQIRDGESETWDDFGQGENLEITTPTTIDDLSGYDPDVSVSNSGVGWMANRVTSMTLKAVRYYSADQLIRTDANPRDCQLPP